MREDRSLGQVVRHAVEVYLAEGRSTDRDKAEVKRP
jgi:hypothetical protein